MPTNKEKKQHVRVSLIEITKSGSNEKKRFVEGISGDNLDIEYIGGIWKERRRKIACPECNGLHTTIELSIQDVGWDVIPRLNKAGGSIESLLGCFDICCYDCKKVFVYSPSGKIRLSFIEEAPYGEKKQKKTLL